VSSRSVRIPSQLAARVEALGEKERRRFAAMTALLIEEALEARSQRVLRHSVTGKLYTITDADSQSRDIDARRVT